MKNWKLRGKVSFNEKWKNTMKIGDKVRFLSEVGGGTVSGFQGKNIVLVEDEPTLPRSPGDAFSPSICFVRGRR